MTDATMTQAEPRRDRSDNATPDGHWPLWRHEEAVMRWYGWGSPVGLSVALVSFAVAAVLLRRAVLGS